LLEYQVYQGHQLAAQKRARRSIIERQRIRLCVDTLHQVVLNLAWPAVNWTVATRLSVWQMRAIAHIVAAHEGCAHVC
jgi:hypothetical protein